MAAHNDAENKTIRKSLIEARKFAKGKLLDVGANDKPYRKLFENYITEHIGVDIKDVTDFQSDYHSLPFRDNSFDTILCNQALQFAEMPHIVIEEMYRVLRPGGYLIMTTPMTWALIETHDKFRFTESGLRFLLRRAGFDVIYIKPRIGLISARLGKPCPTLDEDYPFGHITVARK